MYVSPFDSLTGHVRTAIAEGLCRGLEGFHGLGYVVNRDEMSTIVKIYRRLAGWESRTSGTSDNCGRHIV